jgi:3alpha(or 20beta)-hydroxysteroid dehydrogenase
MSTLTGRTVVVTGAASGIGAAVAVAARAEGARVVAADRTAAAEVRTLDVRDPAQWAALAQDLTDEGVHGLVNCAGTTWRARLGDVTPDAFTDAHAVNVLGPLLGIQALAPLMTGGGSIVNVASLAALTGHFATAYTASKWGLRGVSRSACTELGPLGIRVNTIFPGAMAAPMTATPQAFIDRLLEEIPLGRAGAAEDVAPLVVFLISDESSWISGAEIAVDGGQSAHGGMKGLADLVRAERSRLA